MSLRDDVMAPLVRFAELCDTDEIEVSEFIYGEGVYLAKTASDFEMIIEVCEEIREIVEPMSDHIILVKKQARERLLKLKEKEDWYV